MHKQVLTQLFDRLRFDGLDIIDVLWSAISNEFSSLISFTVSIKDSAVSASFYFDAHHIFNFHICIKAFKYTRRFMGNSSKIYTSMLVASFAPLAEGKHGWFVSTLKCYKIKVMYLLFRGFERFSRVPLSSMQKY